VSVTVDNVFAERCIARITGLSGLRSIFDQRKLWKLLGFHLLAALDNLAIAHNLCWRVCGQVVRDPLQAS
jgi:hypothetical protein